MNVQSPEPTKPLLLLDVDGPINPAGQMTKHGTLVSKLRAGEEPFWYELHHLKPTGWDESDTLPAWISAEMGSMIAGLQDVFQLVWCTAWEHEANRLLSPLLGLPTDLPVIEFPAGAMRSEWAKRHLGSWKTPHILAWLKANGLDADGTPLPWVWADDEVRKADRAFFAGHYGEEKGDPVAVPRWIFHIEPSHGFRRFDFDALKTWAGEN